MVRRGRLCHTRRAEGHAQVFHQHAQLVRRTDVQLQEDGGPVRVHGAWVNGALWVTLRQCAGHFLAAEAGAQQLGHLLLAWAQGVPALAQLLLPLRLPCLRLRQRGARCGAGRVRGTPAARSGPPCAGPAARSRGGPALPLPGRTRRRRKCAPCTRALTAGPPAIGAHLHRRPRCRPRCHRAARRRWGGCRGSCCVGILRGSQGTQVRWRAAGGFRKQRRRPRGCGPVAGRPCFR